ncbi:MAG: PAS domain S-box protein [Bacteroidota bacterium]
MKNNWTKMKSIIEAYGMPNEMFLSLIDEEGTIVCANANMIKSLHLQNPRNNKQNFFELLHPSDLNDFKNAIRSAQETNNPFSMDLSLKNGKYHSMKWQVNNLPEERDKIRTYLCVGHKLSDPERLMQFHQLGEKHYQLLLEGLNTGILFQDKKGELVAANKKAAEIFNTTLERLYQLQDIENLWNNTWTITNQKEEKISFSDTPFRKALQTGKAHEQLLVIRLRSGENRWINFKSQPLFEEGGKEPFAVVSNMVDLTQEEMLYVKLKESEALFIEFMKQTSNHAWVLDENCNLVFANESFCHYYALEGQSWIGKRIIDLWPAAIINAWLDKHVQVLETGQPIETIEKIKWADGTNFIFHINIFPIYGINGKKMVGAHAVNIASKYEVEKRLREANDRLLLLSRTTSDAIWEWDMQTGHIFRNDVLMDMIGYQTESVKGLSWWLRRIHPEDRNRVTDTIKDATESGRLSWEEKYRFKCEDNTYKHIQDRGYVVYENGLPVKMIGSLQDVTGLKELEQRLMEEKLERQKEISETVIQVQEKERSRIGHELHDNVNQILSTVKLFVEMLSSTTKEETKIKEKSIEYVMMAINEIRKLSKELVEPQLKGVGLVKSIWMMIEDIHLSNAVKIKFTHDHENDLLTQGKKVTLFRIVQEQMKNILNHSKATNVDIYLHCKDNDTHLIIKDNGVGFNPSQTHRGIGLSNIYERTRFYNGVVDIKTSPGNGCTLTVKIPSFS